MPRAANFFQVLVVVFAACREANPAFILDGQDGGAKDAVAGRTANCPDDQSHLVACFLFDDGTVSDGTPNHMSVTVTPPGGVTFESSVAGSGKAVRVGGQTTVKVAENEKLASTTFTIEVMVKPSSLPGGGSRVGIIDNPQTYSLFVYAGGDVRCRVSQQSLSSGVKLQTGVWSRLACSYDGNTIKFHVNGELASRSGVPAPDVPAKLEVVIGGNDMNAAEPDPETFDGAIDNVRIWNVPREPGDLCASDKTCVF